MLIELWTRATSVQPPLLWWQTLLVGLLALALTWSPGGYRLVRHVVTLVHEAGHAFVALLAGRSLQAVRLHSDTSGVTVSRGRPTGPGMAATVAAGYPAPALFGLSGAGLLGWGYAAGLLWFVVVTCALLLLLIRNLYGLWVALVTGVSVAVVSWLAPPLVLTVAAHLVVWALLLAAPRSVLEMQSQRRRGNRSSDADQLARLTKIPALFWIAMFWLICTAALLAGAYLLLLR